MSAKPLLGKVALVTGATRGIGKVRFVVLLFFYRKKYLS
jgi:hypothetical protein